MSTKFASADRQTIIEKTLQFLRRLTSFEPTRSWREEDGIIYFSVKSDGTTGKNWIKRLECNDFFVESDAEDLLRSPDFKPTRGVTTEVAVFRGSLFESKDRMMVGISDEAKKRKFSKPNAELACLILEKFTRKELEAMHLLRIIVMCEFAISNCYNYRSFPRFDLHDLELLYVYIGGGSYSSLYRQRIRSEKTIFNRIDGFAFAVSQKNRFSILRFLGL